MLGSNPIIAFVPTRDFEKARRFYEATLGLHFRSDDGFALVFDANGVMVRVAKVPDFVPLPFTILGWQVSEISKVVARLAAAGVIFERYGFPGQDDDGVWTSPNGARVAWFKDPDGNVLSISEHIAS